MVLPAPALLAQPSGEGWRDQGVLHLKSSPHAKVRNVPVRAVRIRDGFWSARRKVNVERSIPTLLELLEQHGVVDNFRRVSGRKKVERRGPLYTDSDLYKWMEAVAFVLQSEDRPELRATFDRLTDEILAAQEARGYLNTYYVEDRVRLRFQEMQRGHELYCLGHLLQAAIAYYRATGDRKLLDGGIKFVDYLIATSGQRPLLTGHPELELALVELYRTTGDRRHLELAGYLLRGERERLKLRPDELAYMFSGMPFTERTKLEGHAVRAMYAASGAADYYLETGEAAYWKTLERLWKDMTAAKMYITGGVGSRARGEAFGEPYELPNLLAYTESCAAIGNMFWNWRLLAATGDARYTDVLERALYNGVNSGMSLNGTLYCYRNPLELTGNPAEKIRNPWYSTTCCPPNLERVLASLPGYFYGISSDGVYIHLYDNSELDWRLDGGAPLKLIQKTDYPRQGTVEIQVQPAEPREFTVYARIPGWTPSARVLINGRPAPGEPEPGRYFALRRQWRPGDRLRLEFDMRAQLMAANPRVRENAGRAAVQRGPLVYAMEGIDQKSAADFFDLALALGNDLSGNFTAEFRPDLLGGVMVLRHPGVAPARPSAEQPLYMRLEEMPEAGARPVELTLIPYYAFANRAPTPMQVWIPYRRAAR